MATLCLCSVDGCRNAAEKRGWCNMHYKRWRRTGSPLGCGQAERGAALAFAKAAAKIETDDCINWPYPLNQSGYGVVTVGGRSVRATHIVLEAANVPRPSPQHEIAHAPIICHNPACVNPRHLRWATRAENIADKRIDGTLPLGSEKPLAKLSDDDVRAIRASKLKGPQLAEIYGIHCRTVYKIRARGSWRHLE